METFILRTQTACNATRRMQKQQRTTSLIGKLTVTRANIAPLIVDDITHYIIRPMVYAIRLLSFIVTLRAKLSGAVYCNRSCLWVCNGRVGGVGRLPR